MYSIKVRIMADELPLVVVNTFGDEPLDLDCPDCNLMVVHGIDWNKDMSPWKAEAVFKGEADFDGGADSYLKILTEELIPQAKRDYGLIPEKTYIAGYSLAGLFSLYSLYNTDYFDGACSCSGSLWYPGFREYAIDNDFKKIPARIYLSLGDKEAKTKNPIMSKVEENTRILYEHYVSKGIDAAFVLNPGGQFKDERKRLQQGINRLVS